MTERKRGRPPKPEGTTKPLKFQARVTEEQYKLLTDYLNKLRTKDTTK